MRCLFLLSLQALVLGGAAPIPRMLSDRVLDCTLGRVVNFDPARQQTDSDLKIEGRSRLKLFLPGIAVRETPPPDATDPAEPVDRRTRIVADPDGLTKGFPPRFDRVVDLWPERVELATVVDDPLVNTIVIAPIDPVAGIATIFMARATDAATYDLSHLYRGKCVVTFNVATVEP